MKLGTVAFIGGGNMARCLIGGLVGKEIDLQLRVAEPDAGLRRALAQDFALQAFDDNVQAVDTAATWVLAVKPQVARAVCEALSAKVAQQRPLVLSIMAGVTSAQLQRWLGSAATLVRCMPNTPAFIGAGVTGIHAAAGLPSAARAQVEAVLAGAGKTVWLDDEAQMDAVTAVSGSGPAYVFLLAEAMQRAGQAQGLPAAAVGTLVQQTILGAARMLLESTESAPELRARVTSPGGTTQAAVETLLAAGFMQAVEHAVANASERSRALSQPPPRSQEPQEP